MRRALRLAGAVFLVVVGTFLVVRAVVEVISVDPGRPATYRQDWGGPSYAGVLLVHAGPGLLVLGGVAWMLWRRWASTREDVHQRPGRAGEDQHDDERRP
jgi:hypothetical protein